MVALQRGAGTLAIIVSAACALWKEQMEVIILSVL